MDDWLTVQELAAWLKIPEATLYAWRSRGSGPRGAKIGRHVRYRRAEVEEWLSDPQEAVPVAPVVIRPRRAPKRAS